MSTPHLRRRALLLTLLLIGAALRFADFGQLPPGLYHDEAQHGLDALAVLQGQHPLYFTANNGREPLYIYLVAASVRAFGRSPWAVRLPSFFIGFLTLAATCRLARQLWGRKEAGWALAVFAVTFWPIHLSRVAFRAVLLPLFTALFLAEGVRAVRRDSRRAWLAAGLLYGAAFYTYTAVRFTPVALGLFFHLALWRWREPTLRLWRKGWVALPGALAAVAPLALYALRHPEQFLLRTDQVSILNPAINGGDLWGTLWRHALRTAGMFFVRGDFIWRHNLALRPVWRLPLGFAFIVGLLLLGREALRARPPSAAKASLVLLWTVVMMLPTLLAEDAPHFLRGVGVLPTAALIPAYGLAWLERRGEGRRWLRWLPFALLLGGGAWTTYDLFVRYAQAPQSYAWFEAGPVEAAGEINALRGVGWDGQRMLHGPASGRALYADGELWGAWTAVPFLVPREAVTFALPERLEPPAAFVAWPYEDWIARLRPRLVHPLRLGVEEGPSAQGDRDPEPFLIAYLVTVDSPSPPSPPLARFEEGIVLQGVETDERDGRLCVRLLWQAGACPEGRYKVFVHALRGETLLAQHDGEPTYGLLPTSDWQAGDQFVDEHCMAVGEKVERLRIGLYEAGTLRPLQRLDAAGAPAGTWIELPLPPP